MAKTPSKLSEEQVSYIEKNFLSESPEGLPPVAAVKEEVVAEYVPVMKRVIFLNGRDPGQELMFHYHSKTHPLKHYTLYHGKEYDLSEEIIEHLETRCEAQYGHRIGASGHPEMYYKAPKYIFRCQPVKRSA